MDYNNNVTRIRREVMIRLVQAFYAKTLEEDARLIPYQIRPKDHEPTRCCIYKDRAVLRCRCMAAMGFAVEDETDDSTQLSTYATQALEREEPKGDIMTVLEIACKGCVSARYLITNACQGCMARPCKVNCPFDAIYFEGGKAHIDQDKCRDCGKCLEVCPYNAVTHIPVPCEEACPVDAIKKSPGGKAHIDFDACISCGRCMRACPFGAVMERSQVIDVLKALEGEKEIIAMVAPSIAGQFPGDLEQIAAALREVGFNSVIEVAVGADITARKEAHEFIERMEEGRAFMTTSCCPGYIEAVKRHIPELKPFVSDTETPMHYTAELVKKESPDAVAVFIGPCVAKRREGMDNPFIDFVLTYEEVGAMLVAKDIEVAVCEGTPLDKPASAEGRGFPITGGVAAAVKAVVKDKADVNPIYVNGLDPKAVKQLRNFCNGKCPGNLVEVMACEGGCVGGMGVVGNSKVSTREVANICKQSKPLQDE